MLQTKFMPKPRFNIVGSLICGLGLLFSFTVITARADVKLPAIFSDHMVLQRDTVVPVWGWAEPGEAVIVSIAGQTKKTTADAAGKWSVKLDNLSVAGQTNQFIAMFDRWNKWNLHDSCYVWLPLEFDADGKPVVHGGINGRGR
jgi:hypothetical protein